MLEGRSRTAESDQLKMGQSTRLRGSSVLFLPPRCLALQSSTEHMAEESLRYLNPQPQIHNRQQKTAFSRVMLEQILRVCGQQSLLAKELLECISLLVCLPECGMGRKQLRYGMS